MQRRIPVKCVNCRHWTPDQAEVNNPGFGTCNSPAWRRGYGLADVPRDGVVVENDEGWGFLTGPDFGCVHFVVKADR